jgi:hypothetical protein
MTSVVVEKSGGALCYCVTVMVLEKADTSVGYNDDMMNMKVTTFLSPSPSAHATSSS